MTLPMIPVGSKALPLAVPAAAVQLGPQGPYVFVIKDGGVAELRPIDIKRTQNLEAVIGKGLAAGEQVVVDGQLRLVNGAAVATRPAQGEAPSAAPPPAAPTPPKPSTPRG